MKRRDTLCLLPFSLAGAVGLARNALAQQPKPMTASGPSAPMNSVPGLGLYAQYSRKVKEKLTWIRRTQSENLLEASHAIARTIKSGNSCWSVWDTGHSTQNDQFPGRNGEPEFMHNDFSPETAKKGDLLLANRFLGPYDELVNKDIFVVGGPAPWGGDAQQRELLVPNVRKTSLRPYSKIWIETNISTLDAEINLPGEPAPFGPFSGILGMLEYWMILADSCRILSREGYKGTVKGDEPPLGEPKEGDKISWVNSEEPLMSGYFDTCMQQIDLIGSDMGDIKKMAEAVVDAVLKGGKVYYYSRYYVGLATEALGRRGGLALNRTDWEGNKDFKPSPKDVVIMGLCKPDDEVDLKHLDVYKKAGMKVFSIGPSTRSGNVPSGRTVPKETSIHVGACETYGLYAIPGFNRRVCPTSGPVMNQIYWAIQMEVAENIIRRTGNAPGVFFSAAVEGGNEHNALIRQRCDKRGY